MTPAHLASGAATVTDTLTKDQRSAHMAKIRSCDTGPEMLVRKMVYGLGYRYRLHARELPGCPDLVFRRGRRAIFVHGCFWHQHSKASCRGARMPKSRARYWKVKLERNRQRDSENRKRLAGSGWSVLELWECELRDRARLEQKISRFLSKASPSRNVPVGEIRTAVDDVP